MRKAGDVVFTDVDKYGEGSEFMFNKFVVTIAWRSYLELAGVVEFSNRDDMEYAIKSLDDTGIGIFF